MRTVTRRRGSRTKLAQAALATALVVGVTGLAAADDAGAAEITPLVAEPVAKARPMRGADGRHLAYELVVTNFYSGDLTVENVDVIEPRTDAVLDSLDSTELESVMVRFGGGGLGHTLGAGAGGFILFDVQFDPGTKLPKRVVHEFTISVDPAPTPPATVPTVFRSGSTVVSPGIGPVVAPPLRGDRWIVGEGCCASVTAHRGAVLPIDGKLYAPERFAIDFVQLDQNGLLFTDGGDENTDYGYYNDKVRAASPGLVVATNDGVPDNPPGEFPEGISADDAGGNYVIVDIGDGNYAFYAHLIPGSLKLGTGDEVATGDVLGRLGNSGNSDAPHLHFHLMSRARPLAANGLPYRFSSYDSEGTVSNIEAVVAGGAAEIDFEGAGSRSQRLPFNLELISFSP